jgi:hypothetical protein
MGCIATSRTLRAAGLGLLICAFAGRLEPGAHAASYSSTIEGPLNGGYIGGNTSMDCCGWQNSPAIGDSPFDIYSAAITLNTTTNTLTVQINTDFAGQAGTDGVAYGSLFLAPASNWTNAVAGETPPYYTDQFHPGEWTYAFVTNSTSANLTSGAQTNVAGGVYAIGTDNGPGGTPTNGVYPYEQTSGGQIVMSNVDGDPASGTNGWLWRQNQPVTFVPNGSPTISNSNATPVTMTVGTGSITYTISDYSALDLNGDIAISWAMTCANGIVQGVTEGFPITFTFGNGSTPLPAGLPLFAGGLGVLGIAGLRRRKKASTATPA